LTKQLSTTQKDHPEVKKGKNKNTPTASPSFPKKLSYDQGGENGIWDVEEKGRDQFV